MSGLVWVGTCHHAVAGGGTDVELASGLCLYDMSGGSGLVLSCILDASHIGLSL